MTSTIIDNMLILACAFAIGETILNLTRTQGQGPIVQRIAGHFKQIAVAAVFGMAIGAGLGLANIRVAP